MPTTHDTFDADGNLEESVTHDDLPQSPESRIAAIEARLDRAAAAPVTGEAAKLRDAIKAIVGGAA